MGPNFRAHSKQVTFYSQQEFPSANPRRPLVIKPMLQPSKPFSFAGFHCTGHAYRKSAPVALPGCIRFSER